MYGQKYSIQFVNNKPIMQKASLCISRPIVPNRQHGQSLDEYKQIKILPHISEQYQFRITNRLLIEKIIKPRRDKTIIDSLAHTAYNHIYKKKNVFCRNLSAFNNRRKLLRTPTAKNRNGHSFQRIIPEKQLQTNYNKPQFPKELEKELQKMNDNKEKNSQICKEAKKDQQVQYKRIDSLDNQQNNNLNCSRDQNVGKIVRNHSKFITDLSRNQKVQREKRFTPNSNRPIITNNFIKQEKPKQKMKRLIKRIYQAKDKQNIEEANHQY